MQRKPVFLATLAFFLTVALRVGYSGGVGVNLGGPVNRVGVR